MAISTAGPVGIDVESCKATAFDEFDVLALDQWEYAHRDRVARHQLENWRTGIWTAKEAVLKATGHGLSVPPSQLGVSATRVLRWPQELDTELRGGSHLIGFEVGEDYIAYVALLGPDRPQIDYVDATTMLTAG